MAGQSATPDLAAILANLAQFAAPAHPPRLAIDRAAAPIATSVGLPRDEGPRVAHKSQDGSVRTEDPRLRPQSRSTASPKPMIDPATITTWQEGLRCVTKIAAQNSQFAASIRKMMEDQRRNEMRWYTERQNLKQAQSNRAKSSAEAYSILQSLTSDRGTTAVSANGSADMEMELANFDRKIYDAQSKMEMSMIAELKGLGVPFFGTDQALVVADENAVSPAPRQDERAKWSPIVTRSQLLGLQRRMVAHLEDLYRD